MFNIFKKKNKDLKEVAEKQLNKNISVIESLRDYDTGKKDISTRIIERRLPVDTWIAFAQRPVGAVQNELPANSITTMCRIDI